jgi:hypothetical protein
MKQWEPKMFLTDRRLLLPALLAIFLFMALLTGCGLRQSQTGSLSSRVIDADGNAVVNAEVFSIFAEREKVLTGLDGGFYLSELPAGVNNIVILHADFALEERQIEIKPDDATVVDFIRLDRANAPNRISDVKVVKVASTSAEISWRTYRSVVCNLEYGTGIFYGNLLREQRPATEHKLEITGLNPETLYHFRVQYLDEDANSYASYDYSFKTTDADRPYPPKSLKILPFAASGMVELEWVASTVGDSTGGFIVYRQVKGEDWVRINENIIDVKSRKFSDIAAEAGKFCRYGLCAVNGLGAGSEMVVSEMVFVPGVITSHTVLKAEDSPVKLYSDIIVAAGTSLTIEAGTEIQVSDTDALAAGSDEQRVELIVQGRIEMQGTAEAPVVFAPLNGSGRRDHWAGIRILSSLGGVSDINYASLFGCSGFALEVSAENARIKNLSVSYSEQGILLNGVREVLSLSSCSFSEIASVALEVRNCRRVSVENGMFKSVDTGIAVSTASADDQIIVKNTDIYAESAGIKGVFGRSRVQTSLIVCPAGIGFVCEDTLNSFDNHIDHVTIDALEAVKIARGSFNIQNTIIVNRYQKGIVGVRCDTGLEPEYHYNNLYGFSVLYQGCIGGSNSLSVDPKFAAGNPFDYRLMAESTLKLQDSYGAEMGRYGVSRL